VGRERGCPSPIAHTEPPGAARRSCSLWLASPGDDAHVAQGQRAEERVHLAEARVLLHHAAGQVAVGPMRA